MGSAVPAFAMTDLDSAVRGRIPDKQAALALLERLLENGPDAPAPDGTAGGAPGRAPAGGA